MCQIDKYINETNMSNNMQTPTKLTEFGPFPPEEKPQSSVTQLISKFFKINRNEEPTNSEEPLHVSTESAETVSPNIYPVDISEGRSLPNVLKRISNLLALKSDNLQDYSDTELKQYWMPDSVSKECYECSEKFTMLRRRHHCRVCGQIFCSQCCNLQISGKIFGCTGGLRVCTYCGKIIHSYLKSLNLDGNLSPDLKALLEHLENKFGSDQLTVLNDTSLNPNLCETSENLQRKISVGYQEEKFGSEAAGAYLTNEEKCRALQNSVSVRNLYEEICKPTTGLNFASYKYHRLMYTQCFLGSELVDWLIRQQKANTRVQAATLSQALLDGNYIEAFLDSNIFVDGHVWYQKGNFTQLNTNIDTSRQDSSWVQQLPHESSNTDSDSELLSPSLPGISTSNSYTLNLNVEANSAYLSRPLDSPNDEQLPTSSCKHDEGITAIRLSEQRELAPESGWFDASCLREENNEKEAYELLSEAYEQHEQSLLKQLLSVRGLSFSWNNILIPLTREIVTVIRPDKKHDAEQLDIKDYVQVKKLPGGNKEDTYLVNGIVFTKNVVHKDMVVDFENPSILLLECSVVYQRTQGRFMSIEPVMMQEQEYLRHAVARIVTLQPQVVLVQKNISRLAQDMLRQHGITLIHNVKRTVLERLSRCLEADIVNALDAHIGRPKLGSCKRFYLKIFDTVKGAKKTLMFFEGLPNPHLGATVLLRGPKSELERVKSVTSFLIFTAYNWRLEKSFLMDEFALPPNSRMEFLDESKDNSPQELNFKGTTVWEKPDKKTASDLSETQSVSEHKKILVQSVNDHSDPLQSGEDKVRDNTSEETLTVTELPQENNFKKHLEDTILCISPYVIFPMPYLETDAGKKCKLRRFFYKDMYFSEQFELNHKNKWKTVETTIENSEMKTKDLHPFLNEKITNANDHRIQNLLAHFRACGSQFSKTEILHVIESEIKGGKAIKPQLDVLDPMNHQRLAVLFYSFSHESNNAPAFCVDPWVVYMDFYGKNDIPLGCFLEKYCFRTTYACSSKACITPMDNHIRRFVHNSGSVTVVLNRFEDKYDEKEIVMWSSCTKCSFVSPVVSLSTDSWSYSFAKYLELRFHGEIFSRRGPNSCRHSLHHDHYQYFGYNNYVASFKYSPINIWEISLPPSVINLKLDFPKNHDNFIEQAKSLAQKGHDLFNLILEKSSGIIGDELEGVGNIKHLLAKEQNNFKQKIEQLQLTLTSPTIEEKKFDLQASTQNYWKIQEDLTRLKGILVDLVDTWNTHLGEAIRKSDKKKEKPLIIDVDSPISETSEGELAAEVIDSQEDIIVPRIEDSSTDSKKEFKKEKSMKNLLDKFLPSSGQASIIQSPFSSQEHYNLPAGVYGLMPVYELEVSSIIAYALNSLDYKRKMEEMHKSHVAEQTPSPIVKRKNIEKSEDNSGLLGFLRNKDMASAGADYGNIEQAVAVAEDGRKAKNLHVEIEFKDATCSFFCCIYLAEKFAALRAAVVPFGEEGFIRSLNRCIQWRAVGGKSGSSFHKTVDDRFIMKGMLRSEVQMFLESSSNYFAYMEKCRATMQPTLLGKIVGVYQVWYNSTNSDNRTYVLIMENLFYGRNVSQKFDLKGSMRNRLVVPDNRDGDVVLQDENLSKMICDNPLYVLPHSKKVFLAAISNDTEFLFTQSVMDYSLLVGLDANNKELVLGIIDYIRTFTLDKKLETMVKRTPFLGLQNKLPTIICPENYQKRFIEAMHRYFLAVPDHFAGLDKDLDIKFSE